MIPAAFDYVCVGSRAEAIGRLSEIGDDAKILAGGHSLLPLMKLRLATPAMLIDIGGIADLSYISDGSEYVAIGATTRHRDLQTSSLLQAHAPLLPHVAGWVGDPQVRHRGTIGGSLAHGDPASDLPAAVLALGASLVAEGPRGARTIPAADFFRDFLETALADDEILTEIRIPKTNGARWSYQKFTRRAQDWAIVGVAAVGPEAGGRIALVNAGTTPLRVKGAEAALAAGAAVPEIAQTAAAECSPPADLNASTAYRRHLIDVLIRRALAGMLRP